MWFKITVLLLLLTTCQSHILPSSSPQGLWVCCCIPSAWDPSPPLHIWISIFSHQSLYVILLEKPYLIIRSKIAHPVLPILWHDTFAVSSHGLHFPWSTHYSLKAYGLFVHMFTAFLSYYTINSPRWGSFYYLCISDFSMPKRGPDTQ